jgi:ribosomal protein S18 acetylase RimI-like enzyme
MCTAIARCFTSRGVSRDSLPVPARCFQAKRLTLHYSGWGTAALCGPTAQSEVSGGATPPRILAIRPQKAMTLVLRRYEPSDVQAVWALHQLASQVAGVPTPEPYFSDLQDIELAFLNSGGEFIVGECQGQIVAMGGLKRTAGDRAEITRMRVHPHFQRRGLGSALLRHLETRAAALGYSTLHLDTLVMQEAAQQFYRRHGYRCVGSGCKEAFEVVFFEKQLACSQ